MHHFICFIPLYRAGFLVTFFSVHITPSTTMARRGSGLPGLLELNLLCFLFNLVIYCFIHSILFYTCHHFSFLPCVLSGKATVEVEIRMTHKRVFSAKQHQQKTFLQDANKMGLNQTDCACNIRNHVPLHMQCATSVVIAV